MTFPSKAKAYIYLSDGAKDRKDTQEFKQH